jgi:hypothetical protein
MAKRSSKELDAIIRNKLPGYHLARPPGPAAADESDAPAPRRRKRRVAPQSATPSIDDLRAKYLGNSDASRPLDVDLLAAQAEEADIVTVEPDAGDDEPRHAKAVVISPDGEILGAQG